MSSGVFEKGFYQTEEFIFILNLAFGSVIGTHHVTTT
jgi:hypothetical protein